MLLGNSFSAFGSDSDKIMKTHFLASLGVTFPVKTYAFDTQGLTSDWREWHFGNPAAAFTAKTYASLGLAVIYLAT